MHTSLLVPVAAVLVAVPFLAQQSKSARSARRAALQAKFEELHRAGAFPGGTAGFALADGSSFGLAAGVSDRTTKAPMKPTDRLLLGSVGKQWYVSAVALQLVHEGRIGLDDLIAKYLGTEPWFARVPNAAAITVRQLMNHTSGLVRYELEPEVHS